jgi:hypothetical protein
VFAQVPDVDTRAAVRVCDACFEKLGNEAQPSSAKAPRASRHSLFAGGDPEESRSEISIADFEIIKHLGRGAFGQVLEVRFSTAHALLCITLTRAAAAGYGKKDEKIVCPQGFDCMCCDCCSRACVFDCCARVYLIAARVCI